MRRGGFPARTQKGPAAGYEHIPLLCPARGCLIPPLQLWVEEEWGEERAYSVLIFQLQSPQVNISASKQPLKLHAFVLKTEKMLPSRGHKGGVLLEKSKDFGYLFFGGGTNLCGLREIHSVRQVFIESLYVRDGLVFHLEVL